MVIVLTVYFINDNLMEIRYNLAVYIHNERR